MNHLIHVHAGLGPWSRNGRVFLLPQELGRSRPTAPPWKNPGGAPEVGTLPSAWPCCVFGPDHDKLEDGF